MSVPKFPTSSSEYEEDSIVGHKGYSRNRCYRCYAYVLQVDIMELAENIYQHSALYHTIPQKGKPKRGYCPTECCLKLNTVTHGVLATGQSQYTVRVQQPTSNKHNIKAKQTNSLNGNIPNEHVKIQSINQAHSRRLAQTIDAIYNTVQDPLDISCDTVLYEVKIMVLRRLSTLENARKEQKESGGMRNAQDRE